MSAVLPISAAEAESLADEFESRPAEDVLRWTAEVRGRGACHHPDGAARFVESALDVFSTEIDWHRHSRCKAAPAGLPVSSVGGRRAPSARRGRG